MTREKGLPAPAHAPSGSKRKRYDVGENLVQVRDQVSVSEEKFGDNATEPKICVLWLLQTLAYLSKAPLPTLRQDEESMRGLLKELRQWDLTKGEKLQIVNLAPDSAVMLYSVSFPSLLFAWNG